MFVNEFFHTRLAAHRRSQIGPRIAKHCSRPHEFTTDVSRSCFVELKSEIVPMHEVQGRLVLLLKSELGWPVRWFMWAAFCK